MTMRYCRENLPQLEEYSDLPLAAPRLEHTTDLLEIELAEFGVKLHPWQLEVMRAAMNAEPLTLPRGRKQ